MQTTSAKKIKVNEPQSSWDVYWNQNSVYKNKINPFAIFIIHINSFIYLLLLKS